MLSPQEQIREYTANGWWGTQTLADLLLANCQATPGRLALVDPLNRADLLGNPPQKLTYADLQDSAERLAAGLLAQGIGKGDVLMVQLPNCVELVQVYLASALLGCILSPLPVQYRQHELQQTMSIAEPKAFITLPQFHQFDFLAVAQAVQPHIPNLQTIIALGDDLPQGVIAFASLLASDPTPLAAYRAVHPVEANDIYTICWTSGTEAEPKGVPRSHNHWIWIAYASVDGCQLDPGCHLLNPFPMVNMSAIGGMLVPWLLTGGKLVLHHPLDLKVFLGQIQMEQIHYTVAPPALLNMLLMKPDILAQVDMSSIKNIGSGSAPLSPWMVGGWAEQYGITVNNMFGSNEGISLVSDGLDFPDPATRAQYFPRWGAPGLKWQSRIAGHMQTKLVDPQTRQEITEPGVAGELAVKSPGVFWGYYKRPELTANAFDSEGFFYTGDMFEIAGERGELYKFIGRVKEIINRGGMKISAQEIEGLILEHPSVADVALVAYPDAVLGEKACAVVVLKPEQTLTLAQLVDFLKGKQIAAYKLPEKLQIIAALPRNPVGKVLKRVLQTQVAAD
jgi:non-ribosomal peptide synthetase component E (peptide arylation enzyme)